MADENEIVDTEAPPEEAQEAPQKPLRTDLFGDSEDEDDIGYQAQPTAVDELPGEASPGPGDQEAAEADGAPDAEDDAQPPEDTAGDAQNQMFGSDSDEGDGQEGGYVSEAEEEGQEDEFEAMFKGKKRKRQRGREETAKIVEAFLANMEVAAELDVSANEAKEPAVHKLKMLPEVEDKLSQQNLHRELLDAGLMGVLKAWIELLPDFSLPNVKVRSAVLRLLHKIPIDLTMEGRKEQLKKSELGKAVMFLSKLPDETQANRQLARGLVEKWSRPIFEQYREGQTDNSQEREAWLARQARHRQKQQQDEDGAQSDDEDGEGAKPQLRPGDPGFRYHAAIPAPAKLDYMKQPESKVQQTGNEQGVKGKAKPKDKMSKRLKAMNSKSRGKAGAGGSKVSLQGKGLLV